MGRDSASALVQVGCNCGEKAVANESRVFPQPCIQEQGPPNFFSTVRSQPDKRFPRLRTSSFLSPPNCALLSASNTHFPDRSGTPTADGHHSRGNLPPPQIPGCPPAPGNGAGASTRGRPREAETVRQGLLQEHREPEARRCAHGGPVRVCECPPPALPISKDLANRGE